MIIYKSIGRYSTDEMNQLKQDVIESYKELHDDENPTDDEILSCMYDWVSMWFDDDFGESGNVKYTPEFNNKTYVITGTLGLWHGNVDITPVRCDTFIDAINKCLARDIDEFEFYEEDGVFYVKAYHHDGCNSFKISVLDIATGALKPAYFRKYVFGCTN